MYHDSVNRHGSRRGGGRGWGRRGSWAVVPDSVAALHEESRATLAAARQLGWSGSEAQRARATALLAETRRSLYRLLSEVAEPAAAE